MIHLNWVTSAGIFHQHKQYANGLESIGEFFVQMVCVQAVVDGWQYAGGGGIGLQLIHFLACGYPDGPLHPSQWKFFTVKASENDKKENYRSNPGSWPLVPSLLRTQRTKKICICIILIAQYVCACICSNIRADAYTCNTGTLIRTLCVINEKGGPLIYRLFWSMVSQSEVVF